MIGACDRIVGEPEAAVDHRDALDRAVETAEAILDVDRTGAVPRAAASAARSARAPGRGGRWRARDRPTVRARCRRCGPASRGSLACPAPRRGRSRSVRRSGRTRRRRPSSGSAHEPAPQVGDVDHGGVGIDVVRHATRDASRCTARSRTPGSASVELLAECGRSRRSPDLAFEPLDERRVRTGDGGEATETRRPLDELDRVPARGGDPCRLEPGRTTAEHDDSLRQRRRVRTSRDPRSRDRSSARRCT